MQILLSHDVDHMTLWEHRTDLILPKFYVRSGIELMKGMIGPKEFGRRWGDLFRNKWQNIEEVMGLHEGRGIVSCFFLGMSNGKGLAYSLPHAEEWVPRILARGFEAGVHGIAYQDPAAMRRERERFAAISGGQHFGIRMHYLRRDDATLGKLAAAGYTFDASTHEMADPHRVGDFWEFPLQEMDGWALCGERRYQSRSLEQAVAGTTTLIDAAEAAGLKYFSLLFHDRYYSSSFITWRDWYVRVLDLLQQRGHSFITHAEAIEQLSARR